MPSSTTWRQQPLVLGPRRVLRAGQPAGGAEPDAGDLAVRGEEGDLGPLGVQQFLGLGEDVAQDVVDLGRAADRLGEAVQPFQVEVPVGEGGVGPVAEQQQDAEAEQQPGGARACRQADHRDQPERDRHRGRRRRAGAGEQRAAGRPRRPVVAAITQDDGDDAQDVGGEGRRRRPPAR